MTLHSQLSTKTHDASKPRKCTPTLSASYYCSDKIFAAEQRAIFRSAWQYVGHVSMAAQAGSYFTATVVGAEVIIVRARDDSLRAFYNVCQHRGHLLKDGTGQCAHLVCPYHAWTYNLDGSLERAPHADELDGFDRAKAALRSIRMEVFHGLLFVTTDPNTQPLVTQAAGLSAEVTQCAPKLAQLRHIRRAEFELHANWKVAIDNFLECYHCPVVHKSLVAARDLDHYRIAVSSIWASHHSEERTDRQSAWDMSQASDWHAVSWWLWPTLCVVKHPGDNRVVVLSLRIEETRRTVQVVDFLCADAEPTKSDAEYIDFYLNNVRPEDKAVIDGVQRGMQSGGFTSGHLLDATEDDGPWTEHAVAHFQSLVRDALMRTGESF